LQLEARRLRLDDERARKSDGVEWIAKIVSFEYPRATTGDMSRFLLRALRAKHQ